MWRAFFYASGSMLVILGVQCVLVGKFQLSPEATVPDSAKSFLASFESPSDPGWRSNSPFGSTRFDDRFAGPNGQPNRRIGFANYSNPANNSGLPGFQRGRSGLIKTEDWMPWSLIAAGAIVLIYTHSFERGGQE
jgi:hypothetical protein